MRGKIYFRRSLIVAAVLGIAGGAMVCRSVAQSPTQPAFDVASIKVNTGCGNGLGRGGGRPPSPGRLNLECATLQSLIQTAYGTFANGVSLNPTLVRISGGPNWMNTDYYDIDAKAEGDASFAQMAGPLLQKLLEDRFRLKLHRATTERPVYALTVAKSGLKLQRTKEGSCTLLDVNHPPPPPAPGQPPLVLCGPGRMGRNGAALTMVGTGMTIGEIFQGNLSKFLDRPVIDKTELTGRFDFHLEFTPANGAPGESGNDVPAASIFTALQEQLGLKLSPDKGPEEIIVIDQVEKPSEN